MRHLKKANGPAVIRVIARHSKPFTLRELQAQLPDTIPKGTSSSMLHFMSRCKLLTTVGQRTHPQSNRPGLIYQKSAAWTKAANPIAYAEDALTRFYGREKPSTPRARKTLPAPHSTTMFDHFQALQGNAEKLEQLKPLFTKLAQILDKMRRVCGA